jgi:uncharacterized alpha-E superfamily protein
MNMFLWSSDMLKQYGQGHIIVMAESVDEARSIFSKKLEENISFMRQNAKSYEDTGYNCGFQALENLVFSLHFQDDEEIEEGIKHIITTFMNEISQLPTVLDETYLIMGSA